MSKEKERLELEGVVITGVTGPAAIQQIATAHSINPQEVFVRVTFKYEDNEYKASNQLRFFGEEGYKKLLEAKGSGEAIDVSLVKGDKGVLIYINTLGKVDVKDLFATPIAKEDTRKDITELF